MRKIRHTPKYNFLVKSGMSNVSLSTSADISYVQRRKLPDLKLSLWAKFDDISFDGISISLELLRDIKIKSIGSGIVNLYSVNNGKNWEKAFISSRSIGASNQYGQVDFAASELPDFVGDVTFLVEAIAYRQNKKVVARNYFNHLGIFDSVTTNKNMINFLRLTKLDE